LHFGVDTIRTDMTLLVACEGSRDDDLRPAVIVAINTGLRRDDARPHRKKIAWVFRVWQSSAP